VEDLKQKLENETAKIPWLDLQRFFASGHTIFISPELDLIDVALYMTHDNAEKIQSWMNKGLVASVTNEQAREWVQNETTLWSVVVRPWVLVQTLKPEST
jgi:hypothetical protein